MESTSQSLIQVYYLSAVEVDRRCGSSVLPWIIEDLKLKLETAQDMQLVWITLGPDHITYVADTGIDLQQHPYTDMIRCAVGEDNVSFAYIIHSEKDSRSYCHVFQSLVPEEAALISSCLKDHGVCMDNKSEPPTLPGDRLATMIRQSKKSHKFTTGRSLSSRRNSIDPSTDTIFPVTYHGSMPFKNTPIQAETVDKYVRCLSASNRPSSAEKYKKWRGKKKSTTFTSPKTNNMFRLQSLGSDSGDYDNDQQEGDQDQGINDDDDYDLFEASKSMSDLDSIETSVNPTAPASRSPTVPTQHSLSISTIVSSYDGGMDENNVRRRRSDSAHVKAMNSVAGHKKKPWSFRNMKKTHSFGGTDKVNSGRGLRAGSGDGSPGRELVRYESDSLGGSSGSLNKIDGDSKVTPPPKRADTSPSTTKVTPTPAVRVSNLESSGEEEEEESNSGNGEIQHSDKESDFNFDMVHDLDEISQDPEFSFLGVGGSAKLVRQHLSLTTPASLTISGSKMVVTALKQMGDDQIDEEDSENTESKGDFANLDYKSVVLVEATVIQVLCCSQGMNCAEYVGFVTRQKGTKSYRFHLIRAAGDKQATSIVKAFKYAFEYSMVLLLPTYLCDTCPIRHLNSICKELNKRTASESLLQLKDVIVSTSSESDYTAISKDYKKQPFENEHNQVIRWATLLREYFHRKQSSHAHHSTEKVKTHKVRPSTGKKKLLSIAKFSGSYDNLKDMRVETKSSEVEPVSNTSNNIQSTDSVSERVGSPLAMASAAILESQFSGDPTQNKSVSVYSHEFSKYRTMFPTSNSFPPPSLKDSPTHDQSPDLTSPTKEDVANFKKGHRRSMSWRQQIFESVTPTKHEFTKRRASITEMVMDTPSNRLSQNLGYSSTISEKEELSPSARARERWRRAIQQQILLIELERQNQSVIREERRWLRLSYEDPSINSLLIGKVWSEMLDRNSQSYDELFAAVKMGVPPKLREKVWRLLVEHYHSKHPGEVPMGNYPSSVESVEFEAYSGLKTEYESVIIADIDRTFPTHPYFIEKEGQRSLHSVLHAYAVSDTECGYCQGLSFVAGIVLMHSVNEVEAFVLLNHLMFLYGFREIYSQNMFVLQTKLYQFSRLLHDQEPEVHTHLEENDVSPFLYAAPWFLTIFSSQFPIPFVARVFDLVFFEGVEAIYKVSLSLMKHYRYDILQLDNMETITEFLKSSIPSRVSNHSSEVLHSATQIGDLSAKLKTFETEYLVMHELMSTFHMEKKVTMSDTEATNELLRKQNKDLIEQVVMCRGAIMRLESTVAALQNTCTTQQHQIMDQQRRLNRLEMHILKDQDYPDGDVTPAGDLVNQSAQTKNEPLNSLELSNLSSSEENLSSSPDTSDNNPAPMVEGDAIHREDDADYNGHVPVPSDSVIETVSLEKEGDSQNPISDKVVGDTMMATSSNDHKAHP